MLVWLVLVILAILVILTVLRSMIKVVPEYERGVIFRLGRVQGAKGPGLFCLSPLWTRW